MDDKQIYRILKVYFEFQQLFRFFKTDDGRTLGVLDKRIFDPEKYKATIWREYAYVYDKLQNKKYQKECDYIMMKCDDATLQRLKQISDIKDWELTIELANPF